MITEAYGKEILAHLERNMTVLVSVVVGQRGPTKNINRGSLVFVSISFIILMIISSAWLIFHFIQKIRYTSTRDRSQHRLGDAAKKAIGKLKTRTVKKGDKDTESNHCAVCIEVYQLNDVVRILPCKHVFHKACVDPWLKEHCTCPMCKLNILKALGITTSVPCVDSVVLDVDRLGASQAPGSQRAPLSDNNQPSISLEPLSPTHSEATPRTPADITIAVTILQDAQLLTVSLSLSLCFMVVVMKKDVALLVHCVCTASALNVIKVSSTCKVSVSLWPTEPT
uniref:Ring finger protein 130 n=1 Tax=Neolamprologus brichardi TaxID=32507 RepID=A0A3Q4M2Y2_NEOBR